MFPLGTLIHYCWGERVSCLVGGEEECQEMFALRGMNNSKEIIENVHFHSNASHTFD